MLPDDDDELPEEELAEELLPDEDLFSAISDEEAVPEAPLLFPAVATGTTIV